MGDVGNAVFSRGNSALVDECVAFYEEHFPDPAILSEPSAPAGRMKKAICKRGGGTGGSAQGLPVVATNDVRFIHSSDFDAHEIRVAIHDGFTLDDLMPRALPQQICVAKRRCAACRLPISPACQHR